MKFTITATASTGGRAANTPGASRSTVVRSPRRPRSQRLDDGGLQRLVPQPLQRAAIHEDRGRPLDAQGHAVRSILLDATSDVGPAGRRDERAFIEAPNDGRSQ